MENTAIATRTDAARPLATRTTDELLRARRTLLDDAEWPEMLANVEAELRLRLEEA